MVIIDAVIDMGLASVQRQIPHGNACFDRFVDIFAIQGITYGFMESVNELQLLKSGDEKLIYIAKVIANRRLREHRQDDGGEDEAHIDLTEWYQKWYKLAPIFF